MERRDLKPFFALVLVQMSFASLAVVGKIVLTAFPHPLVVAGIRLFFASLFLAGIALFTQQQRIAGRDALKLFGLSLLGIVFNQLMFLEGLKRTSAVNASILIATIPIFTTAVAIGAKKERARPVRIAGILLALAGALVLLGVESFNAADHYFVGNLLIVGNCLSYSFYLVFSRSLLNRYRSTTVVAWTFLYGSMIVVPLAAYETTSVSFHAIGASVWWGLAWIVLVPSVLAYSLNNYALKRVQSSTVASYVFLQPVMGVVLSVLFLAGETVTLRTAIAGLLILAGVFLVSRSETFEPLAAVPESGEAMSRQPLSPTNGRTQPEPQEDHRR